MDWSELFNTFIELNKIDAYPGEKSRILHSRVEFYKKQIKILAQKDSQKILPHLIKTHGLLVEQETIRQNNLVSSSINFLQALISKYLKSIK